MTGRKTIGIIVALREERRPLLRGIRCRSRRIGRFPVYCFNAGENSAVLVETGMGHHNAVDGTETLLEIARPDLLLTIGYGGGLTDGLLPGEIVVAEQVLRYRAGLFHQATCLMAAPPDGNAVPVPFRSGVVITTDGVETKTELGKLLPAGVENVVVEMEAWGVAGVAASRGIPVMAVRGISDGCGEEVHLPLAEITGRNGQVSIAKILARLAGNPSLLPELIRLGRQSFLAGKNLSRFLQAFLRQYS